MCLVSLFCVLGNERCDAMKSLAKSHMEEMGAINRSLSALILCIQQLNSVRPAVSSSSLLIAVACSLDCSLTPPLPLLLSVSVTLPLYLSLSLSLSLTLSVPLVCLLSFAFPPMPASCVA